MPDRHCSLAELIFAGAVTVVACFAAGGAIGAAAVHLVLRRRS